MLLFAQKLRHSLVPRVILRLPLFRVQQLRRNRCTAQAVKVCFNTTHLARRCLQASAKTSLPFTRQTFSMPSKGSDSKLETATFGMGCFWSPDAVFSQVEGVVKTSVGYTGGKSSTPTYGSVCNNDGHTEAIRIEYDPKTVTYDQLLEVFLAEHDPTRKSAKPQYKSAVWTHNEQQVESVTKALDQFEKSKGKEVVTDVAPASSWTDAEQYHQKYVHVKNRASTML